MAGREESWFSSASMGSAGRFWAAIVLVGGWWQFSRGSRASLNGGVIGHA